MANSPQIVVVNNVSKRFILHRDQSLKERLLNARRTTSEEFWALRDVDLAVHAGETLGLMGSNGSGKSTLLKLMGAIIQPSSGTVHRRGRLAALLELGAGFHPDLTGRENVYLNAAILGMSKQETQRKFDEIVAFSEIEQFIDNQVKFYSSGMYVRLAFAVAVHVDPDLLLVDEVLAVGDEPFQRKCMDKIRSFQQEGRTIVLVSHSADQVGDLCDRAVVLRHGQVQVDADTATAIRALRQGFDEDRRDTSAREGTERGQITSVKILDSEDEQILDLKPGQDAVVRVEVELREAIDRWMMGIVIETPVGQQVYHVNSEVSGVRLPPGVGKHTIDFHLPDLRLGAGSYQISVGMAEVNREMIDHVPSAATFEVLPFGLGNGVLSVDSRIVPLI